MDIVLLPCWRRDDFLAATLYYLQSAKDAEKHLYIFALDRGYSTEVRQVAESFPLQHTLLTPSHDYKGNTYNVLEGYKFAISLAPKYDARLIYLIEEDIFVGKDFFTFHQAVNEHFDAFCVSGVTNQQTHDHPQSHHGSDNYGIPVDPSFVYRSGVYRSLGVSWKIDNLRTVTKHAVPEYYRDNVKYLRRHFPKFSGGDIWPEQDGLIIRIMEAAKLQIIYPMVPRAFHAGFVGYNRPGRSLDGTLQERVDLLKTMSNKKMNRYANTYKDIERCSLEDYGISDFVCVSPIKPPHTSATQPSSLTFGGVLRDAWQKVCQCVPRRNRGG